LRHVSWFSCGAASAVATSLALVKYPGMIIARCIVANEHPDNDRFAFDCQFWFGKAITDLRSDKYNDCWDLWEKRRYLNGPKGALCTVEMKKQVRQDFQDLDDVQFFGFTSEEKDRAERFQENNMEVHARFPLIEAGLTKADCFQIIANERIELPLMYRLGYHNANCVGCVKGGKGYWNRIRKDFPEVYERMAVMEESLGASCIKGRSLRELLPSEGRHQPIELPECGLFCDQNEASA